MAGRARAYGMHTDASLRFERGVDPNGQARAIERATALLLEISGGNAGPLIVDTAEDHLPARPHILLRRDRLARLLGLQINDETVTEIFQGLDLDVTVVADGWQVKPPSHRFDMEIEADLIEEVARIHGYDAIPETTAFAQSPLESVTETRVELERAAEILIARDYQEVVTYSFIDVDANTAFTGSESELVLSNPISSEMSVMRASLWPGMVSAAAANVARQQDRVRIFEASKSFHGRLGAHTEVVRVAGLVTGPVDPEQWGSKGQNADFFDIRSDVDALLLLAAEKSELKFVPVTHVALQPGQAAEIRRNGEAIGVVGKLHPTLAKHYDLKRPVYVFELDASKTLATKVPIASPISKFPATRRDIAVIVDDAVSADDLVDAVASSDPDLIKDVRIFDIYKGAGIEAGRKSVAIGLILQETSRTLTDDDADVVMAATVSKLKDEFAAELRD
jgi:phenylalanyl-tRNA synthetase beta chain